ncbi:Uu.00g085140.m01.CDS01 [Anthostomella pinea]|uniref:Uu.00g085140.m01.CDS01 n=1 Tax=Anthostomella pinea TaxID=933095 RepID=A0AAI8VGH8_9PEZI|nr:Uu.00g085140.m01.CDS01 [Anthostomella pinea]
MRASPPPSRPLTFQHHSPLQKTQDSQPLKMDPNIELGVLQGASEPSNDSKGPDSFEIDRLDLANDPEKYTTYHRYPMLANFYSSADNLFIFRGFRYLQARVLLHMQDELRALETQLYHLDERDGKNRPNMLRTREVDDIDYGERKQLIDKIKAKLLEYGEVVDLSHRLSALKKPSSFDVWSLNNFFNNKAPIVRHERYHLNKHDLVKLTATDDQAWFDRFVLKALVRLNNRVLMWIFFSSVILPDHTCAISDTKLARLQDEAQLAGPGETIIYSTKRILIFKMMILIAVMLVLLSGPLYPLYWWSQSNMDGLTMAKIMGLQCCCAMVFGLVLSVCTTAKRHEMLTASASYMALLVVFMGQSRGAPADGGSA